MHPGQHVDHGLEAPEWGTCHPMAGPQAFKYEPRAGGVTVTRKRDSTAGGRGWVRGSVVGIRPMAMLEGPAGKAVPGGGP